MTDAAAADLPLIRRAHAGDADALALAGAATFLETFAGILAGADIVAHCRKQHASELYAQSLADPAVALWLAETAAGAAPVGFAMLTAPYLPLADLRADDLELKRIYLLSRFHGGGTGRRLMQHAVDEARSRGAGRLLLGVYAGNERALAFYARCGYVRVGERRFQVGANTYEDAILALDLTA
ncbi:GNAT family N-acetyltransferase [Lysobacter enzymogenes]|jgi:ribosomal protein S18 acetylase RimI-like enzyme|uniref:GNAT family N-acetyltransferase n=1 Tax=Lysobacter enzymogenes TaxID=69 RepID=UPI000894EE0C|nr:GNAT family N-acetyltransferase [Lysobacter enzymogenes]SDW57980.1 Ribosomal protein S18 acetylase RimI [Lysobacter enzymogenes]